MLLRSVSYTPATPECFPFSYSLLQRHLNTHSSALITIPSFSLFLFVLHFSNIPTNKKAGENSNSRLRKFNLKIFAHENIGKALNDDKLPTRFILTGMFKVKSCFPFLQISVFVRRNVQKVVLAN